MIQKWSERYIIALILMLKFKSFFLKPILSISLYDHVHFIIQKLLQVLETSLKNELHNLILLKLKVNTC